MNEQSLGRDEVNKRADTRPHGITANGRDLYLQGETDLFQTAYVKRS